MGSTAARSVALGLALLALGACAFEPIVCGEWPADGQGGPPRIRSRSHELCAVARESVGREHAEISALSIQRREALYHAVRRADSMDSVEEFCARLSEEGAPLLAERVRRAVTYANERSARPDDSPAEATVQGRLSAVKHGLDIGFREWFPHVVPDSSD